MATLRGRDYICECACYALERPLSVRSTVKERRMNFPYLAQFGFQHNTHPSPLVASTEVRSRVQTSHVRLPVHLAVAADAADAHVSQVGLGLGSLSRHDFFCKLTTRPRSHAPKHHLHACTCSLNATFIFYHRCSWMTLKRQEPLTTTRKTDQPHCVPQTLTVRSSHLGRPHSLISKVANCLLPRLPLR